MPHHFALRSPLRTPLVEDLEECRALWRILVERVTGIVAMTIMPNHVHVLCADPDPSPIERVCNAFARWRNAYREEAGVVWLPLDPPRESGPDRLRRDARYVHLNPVRAGLVSDPLAWPFSVYRDAVDLAPWPLRKPTQDVVGFHRYVSSDPTVAVAGTSLPTGLLRRPSVAEVADAVASLGRVSLDALQTRGPVRRLYMQAARSLTDATLRDIAELAGVKVNAAQRVEEVRDRAVDVVARVAGDPRFTPWKEGNLWRAPEWRAYAYKRSIALPTWTKR